MAAAYAAQEILFMQQLLVDFGVQPKLPIILHEDNCGCIDLSKCTFTSSRTKHLDIRFHYLRHHVRAGNIILAPVPTKEQLADALTKPVSLDAHRKLIKELMASAHQ